MQFQSILAALVLASTATAAYWYEYHEACRSKRGRIYVVVSTATATPANLIPSWKRSEPIVLISSINLFSQISIDTVRFALRRRRNVDRLMSWLLEWLNGVGPDLLIWNEYIPSFVLNMSSSYCLYYSWRSDSSETIWGWLSDESASHQTEKLPYKNVDET